MNAHICESINDLITNLQTYGKICWWVVINVAIILSEQQQQSGLS